MRTLWLVFRHRVGATRGSVEPGGVRKDETFVKGALAP